jgi:restriction system protein
MTMLEAALTVLKKTNTPMSADEIYSHICQENLFSFGAQDPIAILKAQLRKNTLGFQGKSAVTKPVLKQLENKKFVPLN